MSLASPQLSVVMPVYREEAIVAAVVADWCRVLDGLGVDYEFLAYDDGSPDNTLEVLRREARAHPRLEVRRHSNRGHGPTLVRGYAESRGDWIFQTDSDNEMPADHFSALWARRGEYDFLIGVRAQRQSRAGRRLLSRGSQWAVNRLFGAGITDPNCPFRLMKRSWVEGNIARLPEDIFAPNVVLSGLAVRQGQRIFEHPVPHRSRQTGKVSIASWKLGVVALRALRQTLAASREIP